MPLKLTATKSPNLFRCQAGNYYGRSRAGGKNRVKKFPTQNFLAARSMLRDWLEELESGAALRVRVPMAGDSWGKCVDAWAARQESRTGLSEQTRGFYAYIATHLRTLAPAEARPKEITRAVVEAWWKTLATTYYANACNVALGAARDIFRDQKARGLRPDIPTDEIKKLPIPRRNMRLPDPETFRAVVARIESHHGIWAKDSSTMVRFLAYSGLRISEAQKLTWEDIEQTTAGSQLLVSGAKGKGGAIEWRRVPIGADLAAVIAELRAKWKGEKPTGKIFAILSPSQALRNACRALKVPHIRVHDLRHLFATRCIEAGTDIPTVARWLGHKDGGVLAMSIYGHLRDSHSHQAMAKIRF